MIGLKTQKSKTIVISLLVIVVLIVLGFVSNSYFKASEKPVCWPYCPNMTDQDRAAGEQSQFGKDLVNNIVSTIKISNSNGGVNSWKLYSNKEFGFQVKYPNFGDRQNIKIDQPTKTFDGTNIDFQSWSNECHCFAGMFSIVVYKNTDHLSLSDWIEKNLDNGSGLLMKNNNFEFSTFNGISGAQFVGSLPEGFDSPLMVGYVFISPSKDYVYTLTVDAQSNELSLYGVNNFDLFHSKILSTFKFTSP